MNRKFSPYPVDRCLPISLLLPLLINEQEESCCRRFIVSRVRLIPVNTGMWVWMLIQRKREGEESWREAKGDRCSGNSIPTDSRRLFPPLSTSSSFACSPPRPRWHMNTAMRKEMKVEILDLFIYIGPGNLAAI